MTNRISIITDEISQDLAECEAFLRENDLAAVELRMIGERRVPDVTDGDLAILQRWVQSGEFEILALSPGTFKCDVDDQNQIGRQLDETLPKTLELAQTLNARFIITFGFANPTGAPTPRHALEALRTAAEICAAADLPLLIENEPGHLAQTGAQLLGLARAVGHPNFLINWDPTNGMEYDAPTLAAGLREAFPLVRHVHVKNGTVPPGESFPKCCSLRDGDIDWPAHLTLLQELGYDGYFGIETHYLPFKENSVVVLGELRKMMAG